MRPFLRRVQSLAALPALFLISLPQAAQVHARADAWLSPRDPGALQRAFSAAARRFGVPEGVLLALSYNESRWDDHLGHPSTSGGYGPMNLVHLPPAESEARGDSGPRTRFGSADVAAQLLGVSVTSIERDPVMNVRAGAALLAAYGRAIPGTRSSDPGSWYGAVARFGGSGPVDGAFADSVFATMRAGMSRVTINGQRVRLAAAPVRPRRDELRFTPLRQTGQAAAECPKKLTCRVVPAAYTVVNPSDPTDYGNYDVADRPNDGLAIRYIVIHDTESSYAGAIQTFQNPSAFASANYVIRAADGQVTQMVPDRDVAWHAANYYVNMHAIGVEHEGVAAQGATWYSEQLYQTSARLVRYLARRFHVPLDRQHIVGHDEVPGPTPATQTSQHWDPGPFWDWSHYMDLLHAPIGAGSTAADGTILTIDPDFTTNQPAMSYCASDGSCGPLPTQGANFLYLYSAPSLTASLIGDPALHPAGQAGTDRADDWGDKAVTGQRFCLVDQQGEWDAIDYGGREAWLYDPPSSPTTIAGPGRMVTPRQGKTSIPVYGAAYPNLKAYPSSVPRRDVPALVPLQYTILSGQRYPLTDTVRGDFYWSPTEAQHRVVLGKVRYDQISFNHRFAFVRASDVDVLPAG